MPACFSRPVSARQNSIALSQLRFSTGWDGCLDLLGLFPATNSYSRWVTSNLPTQAPSGVPGRPGTQARAMLMLFVKALPFSTARAAGPAVAANAFGSLGVSETGVNAFAAGGAISLEAFSTTGLFDAGVSVVSIATRRF